MPVLTHTRCETSCGILHENNQSFKSKLITREEETPIFEANINPIPNPTSCIFQLFSQVWYNVLKIKLIVSKFIYLFKIKYSHILLIATESLIHTNEYSPNKKKIKEE